MLYLIDSNWVIQHFSSDPAAVALLDRLVNDGFAASIVSYMEAYEGTLRISDPAKARAQFDAFFTAIPILAFSRDVARRRGVELRETLSIQGKRVRPRALDLMIAATAIEHGLTLVTQNKADYQDIPGLSLY